MSQRNPAAPGPGGEAGLPGRPLGRNEIVNIAALAAAAFVFRLLFIPFKGHPIDISTFENWLLTLAQYGPRGFYANVQFNDYPPGYMLILWFASGFNWLLQATPLWLSDHVHWLRLPEWHLDTLIIAVKMPAIIADIGILYLTYLIIRRIWGPRAALIAAGIVAFNPAMWFVSAYWGQADSVAALFLIWSIYFALTDRFELAWATLVFAVLIKPHPIAMAPLLLIWQLRRQGLTWRLLLIPVVSLFVIYLGAAQFMPGKSLLESMPGYSDYVSGLWPPIAAVVNVVAGFIRHPGDLLTWLYQRYEHGRDGYPYNSVNAFNLYAVKNDMWQPDNLPVVIFGFNAGPLWAWGIGIFSGFLAAIVLRLWRTTAPDVPREERENSLLFATFIVALSYFIFLTRMHERYLFEAVALWPLVRDQGPVPRIAGLALSVTFCANLIYALLYLKNVSADLNPFVVHPLSAINVLMLFAVAGVYLIGELDAAVKRWFEKPLGAPAPKRGAPQLIEGLIGFTRLDRWLVSGLTAATSLLLFFRIAQPNERIFDEIYYARSAQEYLAHHDVFEWTHPPLPKLAMAATSWFFQVGLPHFGNWLTAQHLSFGEFFVRNQIGDPVSSRIACAIAGVLTIPLLYAFAKRLFASTGAAVIAAGLLMSSGFFFVQARTALPDIFVGLFSLAALYCGYRFATAGQIVPRRGGAYPDVAANWATIGVFAAIVLFVALEVAYYDPAASPARNSLWIFVGFVAVMVFFAVFWWRRLASDRDDDSVVVYPDGTIVEGNTLRFASGEQRPLKGAAYNDGVQKANWSQDGVSLVEGDAAVTWQAEGTIKGKVGAFEFFDAQRWGVWLVLTGLALGAVTSCKWYGIFDVATLMLAALLVTLQGFLPAYWRWRDAGRSADQPVRFVWGNPLGWRLPLFLAGTVVIGVVVYVLMYIPYFSLPHTFQDMLALQHQMYGYHHDLKATHPYASPWWWWPLDVRPVAYYYHTFTKPSDNPQIVAEVLALPNPLVWLAGLITIPLAGWLAWTQRHKGMLIVVGATFLHWLPWAGSPRIDFQYNIYDNTALVCLCTAYVLWRMVQWARSTANEMPDRLFAVRIGAAVYLALCVLSFAYFYPILGAMRITHQDWDNHIWLKNGCTGGQKQDCVGWI